MESGAVSDGEVINRAQSRVNSFVEIINKNKRLVWNKKQEDASIEKFKEIIRKKYNVIIDTYWDLHAWSVTNIFSFWEEILEFYRVIYSERHCQVLPSGSFPLGRKWFSGMKLNFAENLLRYRDDHTAIIRLDEEGNEKRFTYKGIFEEVKIYAAAFRRNGLKPGDVVACYMPNREEAVFAMLGCTAIGAVWGGPSPLYGCKTAARLLRSMTPKFFFVADQILIESKARNVLEDIPSMVKDIESIERVIIVPTKAGTTTTDITRIRNSCLLQNFLKSGRSEIGGDIPDLVFEQLPFDHPVFINFTSGTTGTSKGIVHSAGILLGGLSYYGLQKDFNRSDVLLSHFPCGWVLWDIYASTLAIGSTLMIYDGFPFFRSKTYYWNVISDYNVTYTFIEPSLIEKMEKMDIVPGPCCNLKRLRLLDMGGAPVKLQNFDFFLNKVKNDLMVGSFYGCTEIPFVAGYGVNTEIYSGEIQEPLLGVDLRVLDDSGNSVIGQRGEIMICSSHPCFPLNLLKDESGERIKTTYLTKFPGCWCMNDEGWIDPETKGIVVTGRRDNEFNIMEERFTSSDIYSAVDGFEEIVDSLCICQKSIKGHERAVLFLKLAPNISLTSQFVERIKKKIECELTPFHVPENILQVEDIPYSFNNKKVEKLVSLIVQTNTVPSEHNVKNLRCLEFFKDIPQLQNY